jgi:hypothetical protein
VQEGKEEAKGLFGGTFETLCSSIVSSINIDACTVTTLCIVHRSCLCYHLHHDYLSHHYNSTNTSLTVHMHTITLCTHTTGLFHKGEQAVEEGKAAADHTLSAAERKAKQTADETARSAQEGKEQAKGVFGNLFHKGEQAVDEAAASAEQGKEEAKGVFGNLFHKGEQAVDDVKAEAERKAAEGKRAGRHAANDAARSAEQGKEEAKGVFGGTFVLTFSFCSYSY